MMRMMWHEFRSNLKSLLAWTVILALFVTISLSKFEGYRNSPELLRGVLDSMPRALLDAFGMRSFNLTTLEGFLGVMAGYYYLIVAIATALWSANTIAKEEYNRTADFTLVLPLSRARILTAKILASLLTSVTFVVLIWSISLISAQRYDPEPSFYSFLRLITTGMFFIALIFWAVGVAFACSGRVPRRAGLLAVVAVLATYILSTLQNIDQRLKFLRWFTPFKYFDAADIYREGTLNGAYISIVLIVTATLIALSYTVYRKRDILA